MLARAEEEPRGQCGYHGGKEGENEIREVVSDWSTTIHASSFFQSKIRRHGKPLRSDTI